MLLMHNLKSHLKLNGHSLSDSLNQINCCKFLIIFLFDFCYLSQILVLNICDLDDKNVYNIANT